jgi:hypothetical protein
MPLDIHAATWYRTYAFCAKVAQLVERSTENAEVGGSIPPLGTFLFSPSLPIAIGKG